MKRILLSGALLLAVAAFVVVAVGATGSKAQQGTYKIELDSAFGLVKGAPVQGRGRSGGLGDRSIEVCKLDTDAKCQNPLHAVVTASINSKGFSSLRSDAYCRTRPESLIGEYFVDCQPGSTGQLLNAGRATTRTATALCARSRSPTRSRRSRST